jgi:hypothetical protein
MRKLLTKVILALGIAFAPVAQADLVDGHFSTNQIFDVQYYWSGTTLNASNFIAPYDMNFQHPTVAAGDYFAFFPSTTNPGTYGMGLYNSSGTLLQVVHDTGTLQAIGPDAIFYVGSGFFGTVITTSAGYAYGASGTFTNMDTSVSGTDASSYTWASTTPLGAGQTASSGGSGGGTTTPTYTAITSSNVVQVTPTSNNSPSGEGANNAIDGSSGTKYLNFDRASAGFTVKLDQGRVIEKFTITTANDYAPRDPSKFSLFGSNDGKTWTTIVNNQAITLSDNRFTTSSDVTFTNTNAYVYYFITFDSTKALDMYPNVTNCMAAYGGGWLGTENCNSVQVSDVTYYYNSASTVTSVDTGNGTVANPGTSGATSSLNTAPTVVSTAPGTSTVSTTETPGTMVTTTNSTRGTTTSVTTIADARGAQETKRLEVVRTTSVTATTPITTVVTQTTPVTVTTVTTPTTVTTYSDGTTTTTNGTPVTTVTVRNDVITTTTTTNEVVNSSSDQSYFTRIDQYSNLAAINQRLNAALDSDVLDRHKGSSETLVTRSNTAGNEEKGWWYLIAEGQRSNTVDTYSTKTHRYGFGHEKKVRGNWIVGLQYNHLSSTMSGLDAGGGLVKDHVGIYSLYNHNGWLLKTDLAYSQNSFTNYHSLPELNYSNSGKTAGNDIWLSNRLYTPEFKGFRPFAGVRVENNKRNELTETGSAITAMNYAAVNQTRTVGEVGLRYDVAIRERVNFIAEASQTDTSLTTVKVGVNFAPKERVVGGVSVVQQSQNGVQNTLGQVSLRWIF